MGDLDGAVVTVFLTLYALHHEQGNVLVQFGHHE